MVGRRRTTIAALGLASILAACSGSTSSPLPGTPSGGGGAAPNAQPVTLQMVIHGSHRASGARSAHGPKFVSPATDGLLVRVYPHGTSRPIVQAAFDVSGGSKSCTTGNPRTCSVTVGVPPTGSAGDDFAVTSYDAPPSGGGSFAGAHVLGTGSLAGQRILVGKSNSLAIYLDGVIAGLSGQAAFVSLPADGSAHALSFVIDAADYGNQAITAGTKDPYANPIVVSMTESGGTGHALLSLDGAAGAKSVTLKYSTDSVALKYDGNGSSGYGAAVSISAPKAGGTGGASEAVQVSPLFVSSTSAYFTAATRTLSLSSTLSATMSLTELKATGASTYTATPAASSCTNVAAAGAASGTRASATLVVSGGSAANTGGCTIAFSDGTSTVNVSAVNTTGGGGVGVPPAVTITEYPVKPTGIAFPYGIAAGSDGAMWFTECQSGANKIGRIPTNASSPNPNPMDTATPTPEISEFPLPTGGANPAGITSGPDGALWFTESGVHQVARIPTNATPNSSAQITEYATNSNAPGTGIATGSDGNLWFGAKEGANAVFSMTQTGQILNTYTTAFDTPTSFVIGPDGAMWFTECASPGHLGRIADGQLTEAAVPTTLGSPVYPVGIAVGSDGNIWFTDKANNAIGKAIVTGTGIGTITEIATPGIGTPNGIVSGPDGALWFTQTVADSAIGRVPTNASTTADITLYETPTVNAHPLSITRGPDGNLWFTEQFCECIGRLAIGSAPSAERAKKKHAHVRHLP